MTTRPLIPVPKHQPHASPDSPPSKPSAAMAGHPNADSTHFETPSYLQACPASAMSSNKIDEGYSEDTRSQSGSDMVMRLGEAVMDRDPRYPLPDYVLAMSETERSEFAHAILRSLPTSLVAGIVEKLNPLLHLDPVMHLPPELTFHIFSYLDPETLLRASTLSKTWRVRVLDSPLWKLRFRVEGWNANFSQVRAFEEAEKLKRAEIKERKTRPRAAEDMDCENPSTKRLRETSLFGGGAQPENECLTGTTADIPNWGEQHGAVDADDSPDTYVDNSEDRMDDVSYHDTPTATTPRTEHVRQNNKVADDNEEVATSAAFDCLNPPVHPTLLLPSNAEPKVNWQYLYKQKRRLEENWDSGRFTNFQLPHPDHVEERHTECVYTIQYSGKYLVSGSRDKTLRIWDLDTQRLIHPPLQGHSASVLCLQFDERPEQDILISAGSDCRLILWRFSTGKLIKVIEKAHAESVLNLRFDDRYLVTCSKDKSIKVWNRQQLLPTDDAYPSSTTKSKAQFPSYIINMQHMVENSHLHFNPLPPYSLLMTMVGHGAAVNAIQIYEGQIVSASGDRNVKVWDVRTGACTRTFPGHTKGIACVQFDGRRIVSGSSDETVRIFDRVTGAEVACLQGHSSLVRTVQARFGDLPGNEEELEAEAKAVDLSYYEAKSKGLVSNEFTREQRRFRNAGSRNPQSICATGAKLPPGGGGSKWARIVSGSYDETIIVWKKGPDGAWEKSKILHQSEAVQAAGGRPRRDVAQNPDQANPANPANPVNAGNQGQQPGMPLQANFQVLAQQAHASAQAAQTLAQQAQALHVASQAGQQGQAPNPTLGTGIAAAAFAFPPLPTPGDAPAGAVPPNAANAAAHHHHAPAPHHHHHAQNNHPLGALNQQGSNSRVFKLQFDARRIICCSQDPIIVGWDFANNDQDLIQASQFFGESA